MKTEEEKAAEAYRSTLNELESNSKPQINCLTMLAEDSKEYAVQIAACIENQLKSVPDKRKLPVLYLIDSICKNFPKSVYVQLFTQNIVSNFCNVFEVSDEKVRKSLHKLRMTWNTTKIFPQKKLNAIDERVHEMDPNWPILYKISQQRQTLPQTSQQQVQQSHSQQQPQPPQTRNNRQVNSNNNNNNSNNNNNNNKLHNAGVKRLNNNNSQSTGGGGGGGGKRKRAKLAQNRNNQQQQQPQLVNNADQPVQTTVLVAQPQTFIDPALIQATHDLPQVLPTTYMDPSITIAPSDHLIHQVPTATYLNAGNMIIAPAPTPSNEPQMAASQMLCTPYNTGPPQLPPPTTHIAQPKQTQHQQLQPDAVQSPHLYILESLYGGKQCSNCSLRFDDNDKSYDHHLDWHFRQRVKSESMFARRKWYYPLNLWVQFREINDDEHQENNNTDSNVNELLIPINDHEVPTAPASKDDAKNICSVCHETFEKFWAEEEEEWRLRNARLYEDERVYHPLCLKDYITS